jgi:drug/metabolite transporter (DMT)-like permease
LILRPNFADLGWAAALPLGSSFFFALMVIANRASAGQGSALSMQVFIAGFAMPVLIASAWIGDSSGLTMLAVGWPDWTVIARCAVVAVTASAAHWLAYMGTARAGAATIAPTTYVQMLVAIVLGYLVFADTPDAVTLLGAAIIISAGLALWWSMRKRAPAASEEAPGQSAQK